MMGDYVEIVIDAGDSSRSYTIGATRAGRRVEVAYGRGIIEVTEVTRGGTPVRTARFMSARVLALVEHPAAESRPRPGDPVRSGQADPAAVRQLTA
ncbi:MAG TPA: hypothetical protein VFU36_13505 [Jatrophihabitans sp.]|nr:hypothetical protein [Jatrophihabitans sp.]